MTALADLAAYLEAQGLGTRAVSIFQGSLPMDAPLVAVQDAVIGLIPIPGFAPHHIHNEPGPVIEMPVIQILIRGAQYGFAAAEARAQAAFIALDSVRNQTLSGTFYLGVMALQSPFFLRNDDSNRPILVFSVRCEKHV